METKIKELITIIKKERVLITKLVMADEREDIDTLPGTSEVSMGSNCFVIEDGSVWILNSEDHWIEIE